MRVRELTRLVSKHKWLILAAVVAVTAAAMGASLMTPKVYRSVARVRIYSSVLLPLSDQSMVTELELAKNPAFAVAAVSALNLGQSPEAILSGVSATVLNHSNVIEISATADTAKKAADIANAVAGGYAEWSNAVELRAMQRRAAAAELAKKQVEADLAAAASSPTVTSTLAKGVTVPGLVVQVLSTGGVTGNGDPSSRASGGNGTAVPVAASSAATDTFFGLMAQVYSLRDLTQQVDTLRISANTSGTVVEVVTPAVVDDRPVGSNLLRNAVLGVVVGLILGVAIAFVVEWLGRRRDPTA